ncbi:hypothetical protein CR159_13740 [Pollutimonas subterranea]|uniref:Alcohol dehydrogenase iron-type/glycerol dehydrogenase GldA domain-containing protein n=1 Tax=Pollutimonas subterranea TaxID=2045210 RepID=A0A2N4U2W3_9BURK|nr:iron-containing alcohol dehydrogenase [Pollutimonas subterranea]PLC49358.1 hypothetical protein CR159_13740 [Pollutimonas subterranea]
MDRFTSVAYPVRVHAGKDALNLLPAELDRVEACRAFVICGRSVAEKTDLIDRIRALLGHRFAGLYSRIGKDAPLSDVQEAVEAARDCQADILIAVGAGSVIKATRVVAILLAESDAVDRLVTHYPAEGSAVSPRLHAPKLPIVNILTAGTSAQNRAGSALKNQHGSYRLEFFDPKTRPLSVFWDADALLTAPPSLALSTGVAVYWRALMNMGAVEHANPLVQGSRKQAFFLARRAIDSLTDTADSQARIDICAAALLQNRDEDDGGRPFDVHWIAKVVYALAAATFNLVEDVDQGSASAILTGPTVRRFGHMCPQAIAEMGKALHVWPEDRGDQSGAPQVVGEAVDREFGGMGIPGRLRDLGVRNEQIAEIVTLSLRNFNADRERRLANHRDLLSAVMHDAW